MENNSSRSRSIVFLLFPFVLAGCLTVGQPKKEARSIPTAVRRASMGIDSIPVLLWAEPLVRSNQLWTTTVWASNTVPGTTYLLDVKWTLPQTNWLHWRFFFGATNAVPIPYYRSADEAYFRSEQYFGGGVSLLGDEKIIATAAATQSSKIVVRPITKEELRRRILTACARAKAKRQTL